MSAFDSIISSMKNEPYSTKKQLLEYTLRMVQNIQKSKKPLVSEDKAALLAYAFSEVEAFLLDIPNAASYKEKDLIFVCEDLILGLIMHLCPTSAEIPQDVLAKIQLLVETVAKERYIETALDNLFKQELIEEAAVSHLLSLVAQSDDEYQKGMLYTGLVHYKEEISKFSDDAKALITAHLTAELKRYLNHDQLTTDCVNNLELIADVCRYFADSTIIEFLQEVLKQGYNNINYYATDTLLSLGQNVPTATIVALAENLEYANLTYGLLVKHGKQNLFPNAYSTPEHLAKSDMVHWLMYPTELGKEPDEIEYIGKVTYLFKKDVYYVFKYRSNSDTLGDNLKNKWLIGWSSEDGGTFSNFDEYALYEKNTIDATLKNIKKKLIG